MDEHSVRVVNESSALIQTGIFSVSSRYEISAWDFSPGSPFGIRSALRRLPVVCLVTPQKSSFFFLSKRSGLIPEGTLASRRGESFEAFHNRVIFPLWPAVHGR